MIRKSRHGGDRLFGIPFHNTDLSFRKMIYEAAVKACQDAALQPKDIDGFATAGED